MEVPTLKHFSVLTIIECILNEECPCLTMEMQWLKLVRVLDQGSWGDESKCLLDRVVRLYRHKVTPVILEALLPLNAKELNLRECPLVTEKCLNIIVNRCKHLKLLDLTGNLHFDFDKMQLFSFDKTVINLQLTTVLLEDCPQVDDVNIQALLKNAPLLTSLNIAHCNISDNVFLLNEVEQQKREISFKMTPIFDNYVCKLRTVDVSRCKYFSSTGVRHLCTLCGPTLQSINLSWTKVDCTSLLYLSGYGLPAAVQFFASFGFLGQPVTCRLVSTLQDFDWISQELTKKWCSQLQECFGHLWNHRNARMRDVKTDQITTTSEEENLKCVNAGIVPKDKEANGVADAGIHKSVFPTLCCLEDFSKNMSAVPSNVNSSLDANMTHPTAVCTYSPSTDTSLVKEEKEFNCSCQEGCTNQAMDRLNIKETSLTCSNDNESNDKCEFMDLTEERSSIECNALHKNNTCEHTVLQHFCVSSLENSKIPCTCLLKAHCAVTENSATQISLPSAFTLTDTDELETSCEKASFAASFSDRALVKHKVFVDLPTWENDTKSPNSEVDIGVNKDHSNEADALKQTAPFFKSNVISLSLNGSIFEVEKVGIQCLQQFLRANSNVATLRLYGGSMDNYVSDNVLKLIADLAQNLTCLSLEGCDRITNCGLMRLAACKQLHKVDFTGLHKIEDSAIIELAHNLNLSHLQLAETRVTSASLNAIASRNLSDLVKELDVSWCDEMEDSEGLDNVVRTCTSLDRLMLRECCRFSTTLDLLAANCHNITELSVASNMAVVLDESVTLLSQNLPLLEKIDLGWNTGLTNKSIQALLTNCRRLSTAILEGLKITSAPFLQIISVPDELKKFLTDFVTKKLLANKKSISDFIVKPSELPCLPHRSMTYCTELQNLSLNYCDFVEDGDLQEIVTVAHGSLKIIDYYGEEVEESVSSLENFIQVQVTCILEKEEFLC